MKQVGFIGSYDKKDLLFNIGKVLSNIGLKVLYVDATMMQRTRYIIQNTSSNNSVAYVSDYLGIDVAVGFMNLGQIAAYFKTNTLPYDLVFIDSDNIQTIASYMVPALQQIFLVTSFDQSEINKILEIIKIINKPINVTQVLISSDLTSSQEKALNHRLRETQVIISKNVVQFVDTNIDRKATLQNQLVREIRLKNYTNTYKDSLEYITALIAEGLIPQAEIRREIKKI